MKWLFSIHWVLVAAVWYFGNGMLHDVFVLLNHRGKYDRELLRLLTVGHILLLSGAVVFVCYLMMPNKIQCGGLMCGNAHLLCNDFPIPEIFWHNSNQ